mgnify:FL=1
MTQYDVYGIGNALVDMAYSIDDEFLIENDIAKGHMTLVDEIQMERVISNLCEHVPDKACGGSAANTIFAVQGFGGQAYYSCRVANDAIGNYFVSEMHDAGIATNAQDPATSGSSGRCLILVSPDAQRSMNSYLGVSEHLTIDQVDQAALTHSRHLFIEGYLASSASGSKAATYARDIADQHNVSTSLTLSDVTMVNFFRDALNNILGNGISRLFCNEEEALAWARTDRLDIAARELSDIAPEVVITLGPKGSLCISPDGRRVVAGYDVEVMDTNGAGDMYAGAFLAAISRQAAAFEAARFANFAASRIVTRFGARLPSINAYQDLKLAFSS